MILKPENLSPISSCKFNKVALLHHDIESAEIKFHDLLIEKGCVVGLFDIRKVKFEELLGYDLVFNRVYSSVASRDYEILAKTLSLLKKLEKEGVKCVNSYLASLADYNKYELYKMLIKNHIFTPKTIFIRSKEKIKTVLKVAERELGFPMVVKRNCGGKSYEVTKVYSENELLTTLKEMFSLAEKQGYNAGFILQKFIQSIKEHDCRVAIVNSEFLYSYARTLISRNSGDKWLASTSGGSIELPYNATPEEIKLAKIANKSINASFSESDIIMTPEGPCIIEVNPTAGYFVDNIDDLERMNMIVRALITERSKIEINPVPKKLFGLLINQEYIKNENYN